MIKWIDKNTAVASDGSIFIIDSLGNVRFYPGNGWRRPDRKYGGKPKKFAEDFFYLRFRDAGLAERIINIIYSIG